MTTKYIVVTNVPKLWKFLARDSSYNAKLDILSFSNRIFIFS